MTTSSRNPSKPTDRPAPDKRETLRRISAAARREFAAKGFADARIDDIAQAAGVTKQLVYHYFRSKEELFTCVLEDSSAATMSELVAVELDHLAPRDALRTLLDHMIRPYCDPMLSALAQEGIRYHESHATPRNSFVDLAPELRRKMRSVLARGVQSGDFRADIDPDLFLAAAAQITAGAFVNRYTVATLCGLDMLNADHTVMWRRFAVDFVLAAIERERSSHLPTRLETTPETPSEAS